MPVMVSPDWLGRRIVLRYRRLDTGGQPLSDLVGELIELTGSTATVATRSGPVTVGLDRLVAARPVAADRRQILELERISRRGWRAAQVDELDGWLLHADRGWTGRANSVLPLRTPGRPIAELLAEVGSYYRQRDLVAQIQVPMPARGLLDAELAGRCWTIQRPTAVLTRRLQPDGAGEPASSIELARLPSADWLAGYHYRGGDPLPEHAVQLLSRHDCVRFAALRDGGGVIGIARGTVDEGWLGVTAVEVAPDQRRSGVASALMRALQGWACGVGASRSYLQVDAGNAAALALYRRLGFIEHHRYHYRVWPGGL